MHLVIKRLVGDLRIGLGQRDEDRSKVGVLARELDSEGGEDEVEVTSILKVSRAEEGGTKMSICKRPLCNCLCDCGLPRPGQPVQPIKRGQIEIPGPRFDCVQNSATCPLEAAVTVTMPVLDPVCTTEIVEDSRLDCRRFMSSMGHVEMGEF